MVGIFLKNTPGLITSLHTSMDASDLKTIHRVAHSLKSNGAMLGATNFAELCKKLESKTIENSASSDTYTRMILAIESEYKQVKMALIHVMNEE